jgi:hypothetical protein
LTFRPRETTMRRARSGVLDKPMAKKKPKATLYVDIDKDLKERMDRLAEARRRKLTAEVSFALERYLAVEEAKEGLGAKVEEE